MKKEPAAQQGRLKGIRSIEQNVQDDTRTGNTLTRKDLVCHAQCLHESTPLLSSSIRFLSCVLNKDEFPSLCLLACLLVCLFCYYIFIAVAAAVGGCVALKSP